MLDGAAMPVGKMLTDCGNYGGAAVNGTSRTGSADSRNETAKPLRL